MFKGKIKSPCPFQTRALISPYSLSHSAGDLTGTEASGADVHVGGGAVHDCLDALDVRLHGTVGAAVRVGHLDAESDALVAEFTFGHVALPPCYSEVDDGDFAVRVAFYEASTDIIAENSLECKCFFLKRIFFLTKGKKRRGNGAKATKYLAPKWVLDYTKHNEIEI